MKITFTICHIILYDASSSPYPKAKYIFSVNTREKEKNYTWNNFSQTKCFPFVFHFSDRFFKHFLQPMRGEEKYSLCQREIVCSTLRYGDKFRIFYTRTNSYPQANQPFTSFFSISIIFERYILLTFKF